MITDLCSKFTKSLVTWDSQLNMTLGLYLIIIIAVICIRYLIFESLSVGYFLRCIAHTGWCTNDTPILCGFNDWLLSVNVCVFPSQDDYTVGHAQVLTVFRSPSYRNKMILDDISEHRHTSDRYGLTNHHLGHHITQTLCKWIRKWFVTVIFLFCSPTDMILRVCVMAHQFEYYNRILL